MRVVLGFLGRFGMYTVVQDIVREDIEDNSIPDYLSVGTSSRQSGGTQWTDFSGGLAVGGGGVVTG